MSRLPTAVAEAIEWHARKASGSFDATAQQQLQAWLEADGSHREAWLSLQQHLHRTFAPLAHKQATTHALRSVEHSRRRLLRGALGLGALAVGGQLLTLPGGPLHTRWGADLRTTTAQRRTFRLDDGSRLLLNAESAVDMTFGSQQRRVQLLRGAVLAEVHREPQRLFVLSCPWGEAWLEGGTCLMARQGNQAQLWALHGELELRTPQHRQTLAAGQGLAFDGNAWQAIAPRHTNERSWTQGLLEVHDQTLGDVIDHLRPYHHGVLRVSPRAAQLRISGVFSLDDSLAALAALKDVLPLRVDHYLGLWTRIDLA
ncbi:Protein FecR [Pseudomonas reidholzensis]|uniref:Protein FecR n=1 Tax=Pseudomonas reidholzensis TaxID=1785162 RepID=A0A383RPN4_9PSED|nr:FecR domain-containing protein [Pseudomonas reidholzensis]SYX88992.1 Protein FecR [Pseudomonas reidholzensis]